MNIARARRATDLLAAFLFAPLRESRPAPGWQVLSWDGEQGLQIRIRRGKSILLIDFVPLDAKRSCYARTKRFNVLAQRFVAKKGLSPMRALDKRAADAIVEVVRLREKGLPDLGPCASGQPSVVRELEISHLMVPEDIGHYYINPYVGCTIGCAYCYSAPRVEMSRQLEGLPTPPWGRHVDIKVNAAQILRQEVRKYRAGIVKFGPVVTDPYQPLERRYRITRQCLEVLQNTEFKPIILTRAELALEDLELLRSFPVAAVGFSVPTDDDRVRQVFEPGADSIEARLAALERFHAAGLRTFALVQPMLPMNPARLVARLAPHIQTVRIDGMYEIPRVRHIYEAAGMAESAKTDFFMRIRAELCAAFSTRGIPCLDMHYVEEVLGL